MGRAIGLDLKACCDNVLDRFVKAVRLGATGTQCEGHWH